MDNGIIINGKFFPCQWLNEVIEIISDRIIEKQLRISPNPQPADTKEVNYTVAQVASMVNKSVPTITRHIRMKLLHATKAGGSKAWIISEEDYFKYKHNIHDE